MNMNQHPHRLAPALICSLCALLWGCDKPPATPAAGAIAGTGAAASPAAPAAEAAAPLQPTADFPCPPVSEQMIPAPVDPASGFGVGFRIPAGFVAAPAPGDPLATQRYHMAFQHTGVNRHPNRLLMLVVEQAPAMSPDKAPPLPAQTVPYVIGHGAEDEAAAAAVTEGKGFLAGELVFGGQPTRILRDSGKQLARFRVRVNQGGALRDVVISVSVAKTYPVIVNDPKGEACVADFDRLGLAVARSLAAS